MCLFAYFFFCCRISVFILPIQQQPLPESEQPLPESEQPLPESEQPQVGSLPVSKPFMIAAAQPTPGFTLNAEKGQFSAHAPHSIQAFMSTISAFPSFTDNTRCGQTLVQTPQPVHFTESSFRVARSFKYLCFIKVYSPL
jgi:hypothetical protein